MLSVVKTQLSLTHTFFDYEYIRGKKIAILATDGFEQVELTKPKQVLEDAGSTVHVVSPQDGQIKGWDERTGDNPLVWMLR